jgi:hypothetical protein
VPERTVPPTAKTKPERRPPFDERDVFRVSSSKFAVACSVWLGRCETAEIAFSDLVVPADGMRRGERGGMPKAEGQAGGAAHRTVARHERSIQPATQLADDLRVPTMTSVRYPVADIGGQLVWAADLAAAATRPGDLLCVGCDEPVRLRAGAKNRPHFAHVADAACPGGETALHKTTIRVLQAAILDASAAGRPYLVRCVCDRCMAERDADLGRPGCTVVVDQVLEDGIRPDLLVCSASGQRLAVIEVIVMHAPEDAAIAVFDRLGLPIIRVWPTWETLIEMRVGLSADLAKTVSKTVGCFAVTGSCRFPRHQAGQVPCRTCRKPARRLSVELAHAECWSCHRQLPVLDIVDCTDNENLTLIAAGCPEIPNTKAIGASMGVLLDMKYSKAAGGSYLMHLCTHCKRIQGDNFLYAHDGAVTDTTAHPAAMTLCENGHLVRLENTAWPKGSTAERPWGAVGLVGERAHLFTSGTRSHVSVTRATTSNTRQLIRRMTGLDY